MLARPSFSRRQQREARRRGTSHHPDLCGALLATRSTRATTTARLLDTNKTRRCRGATEFGGCRVSCAHVLSNNLPMIRSTHEL